MTQVETQAPASDVSDILAVLKIGCDAVNDGEQIAASGGKNWLLNFELGSALGGEVVANLSDFPGAIAEAKVINVGGVEACVAFLSANLPNFGSADFSAILGSVLNGIIAYESLAANANPVAAPAP